MLWLWELRDIGIIGVGLLISVLALTQTGIALPLVLTLFTLSSASGSTAPASWISSNMPPRS